MLLQGAHHLLRGHHHIHQTQNIINKKYTTINKYKQFPNPSQEECNQKRIFLTKSKRGLLYPGDAITGDGKLEFKGDHIHTFGGG